ncbi:MAG TPA: alpha/beta hydrolase [Verrucomicrobiota bacterium]|nr:alpha/beta hydrolase [Verrucomicrobiales bacterium]HRI12425.1 alpha/beta hydrolase [Verrucomicrobiota bacterium]
MKLRLAVAVLSFVQVFLAWAADPPLTRTEVIYGRKFGTALTLDVLQPKSTNGYGVIAIISGGFFSSHDAINPGFLKALLDRGYTVFAVVHGSQPRFIIPEIIEDLHRSVRWIRHHAAEYGVDPNHLGVIGGSAGGHLSLTLATQGKPGPADAKDPVDRESSAVQAVACFFPPTDYLNWREQGDDAVGVGVLKDFQPAFGPRSGSEESRAVYGKEISPLYFVTSAVPPTLIIHGEADKLVPIYQAELFVQKCQEAGVKAPIKLDRRPGKDHGWPGMDQDVVLFADWFDENLRGIKR